MSFTEEEVKKAAELRLWIESRLAELRAEIEKLKEVSAVMDGVLRRGSFKTALEITPKPTEPPLITPPRPVETVAAESKEVRALSRTKDGFPLGNAYVSASSVAIIPASDVQLNVTTPPFKSFFLNRILEGMKAKDAEYVEQGKLNAEEMMTYQVQDEAGIIKKIVVNNYRDKSRLNEIMNTAIWVFTRMTEKKG